MSEGRWIWFLAFFVLGVSIWCQVDEGQKAYYEREHLAQVASQLEKETAKYVPWLFNVEAKDVRRKKSYVEDVLENLGSDWLDDWYNPSNLEKHFVLKETKVDAKAQRVELIGLEIGGWHAPDTEWQQRIYVLSFVKQDGRWLIVDILDRKLEKHFKEVDELKKQEKLEAEEKLQANTLPLQSYELSFVFEDLLWAQDLKKKWECFAPGSVAPRSRIPAVGKYGASRLQQYIPGLISGASKKHLLFAQNNNLNLGYSEIWI